MLAKGEGGAGHDQHKVLEKALEDAKAIEAVAIRSEKNAQKTHKDFGKGTNASIEAKREDIVNKSVASTDALTQFALFGSRDGELSVDEFDELSAGVAEAIAAEETANEIFEKAFEDAKAMEAEAIRSEEDVPPCWVCGVVGHFARACPSLECWGCHSSDHFLADCPWAGQVCWGCGSPTHFAAICPVAGRGSRI